MRAHTGAGPGCAGCLAAHQQQQQQQKDTIGQWALKIAAAAAAAEALPVSD